MIRRLGWSAGLALGLVGRIEAQDTVRLVAGRVRDEQGRKLAGAEILDADHRPLGTTDADGWFSIRLPAAATSIGFRRVGFKPAAFMFPKGWGLTDTVTVRLTAVAQELPELAVEATPWKPIRYAGTTKYDDYFRRRRLGLGSFLSRLDLDRKPAIQTLEFLQGIPGIRVTVGPAGLEGLSSIRIPRCDGWNSKVSVFVDGVRMIGGGGGGPPGKAIGPFQSTPESRPVDVIDKLSRIPPGDIEMIEVYRGAADIPAEYHEDGCAVIAVWTRWNAPVEKRDSIP